MIRKRTRLWSGLSLRLALAAGFSIMFAGHARSDVINFTGNVAHDFPTSTGTTLVPGRPGSVAESSYIIQNGWTTGFLVESLRLSYDKASDTLFVGVQTYSITGDADGNGNPGYTDPQMKAGGGVNLPHFGGLKSLTIAFASVSATNGIGATDFVAGIPADKSVGDKRNTNEFTVATYQPTSKGLAYSYGTILNNHVGSLAVDPSAAMPNFEFAVTHASTIPGFNPANGFYVSLFLGSQQAIVVGKEALDWAKVPGSIPEPGGISQNNVSVSAPHPAGLVPAAVPEPASVALFLIGAVALVGASRRRIRQVESN